jgi:hypothetical protein
MMEDGQENAPALSLILCSRNDEYMGNSRWRLETTLNYLADQVEVLGRAEDVEVLVADWGSDIPLREVLRLTPAASRIVFFMLIPPEIAHAVQKDSPFPEVLALNAAARRAKGKYIGRIDQDTLVGRRFLEIFFDIQEQRKQIEIPLESALLFSNIRMIPYRFAERCPSLSIVKHFVDRFGTSLKIEIGSRRPYYWYSVGIWLLSRTLWHECGGFDEEMLYMNGMEINMIDRLLEKYKLINLGEIVEYDFYHLEHYHPWVPRKSSIYRKTNGFDFKRCFHPNDKEWGLPQYPLSLRHPSPNGVAAMSQRNWSAHNRMRFVLLMLLLRLQTPWDALVRWCIKFADAGRWMAHGERSVR